MTILFVGSDNDDLGGHTVPYSAGTRGRDPDYTPVGAQVPDNMQTAEDRGFELNFAAATDLWLHWYARIPTTTSTGADGHYMRFWNDDDLVATIDVTDSVWSILEPGATSQALTRPTNDTNTFYDVNITKAAGDITLTWYLNGVSDGSLTWTTALGIPNRVTFDHNDISGFAPSGAYYSEFIITDGEDTRGWRLVTLNPDGAGNYNQWSGDYTDLTNERHIADKITTDTVGQRQSWTLSPFVADETTGDGIRAVVTKLKAGYTGTDEAPSQITPFVRISGTDYSGTAFDPTGLLVRDPPDLAVFDNNPATGSEWGYGVLDDLEVGVLSST